MAITHGDNPPLNGESPSDFAHCTLVAVRAWAPKACLPKQVDETGGLRPLSRDLGICCGSHLPGRISGFGVGVLSRLFATEVEAGEFYHRLCHLHLDAVHFLAECG